MKSHPNSTNKPTVHTAATHALVNLVPEIPEKSAAIWQAIDLTIEEWLRSLANRRYSRSTIALYRLALRTLARYLVEHEVNRVQDINAACLEGWRAALISCGLAANSITSYLGVARNWCRWLSDCGRMFFDPGFGFKIPPPPRPLGTIVSEEEMQRFIDGINGTDVISLRDRAIAEVAYGSAARLEEMTRLNVESLDLQRGFVRLYGKGNAERMVPLTRSAVAALKKYVHTARTCLIEGKTAERALFLSAYHATRLCAASLSRILRDRAAAAGLVITPHVIRRSIATHLVQHGAPIAHVKALLGHRTYRHLGHYVRLREALDIDAVRNRRAKK